MDEQKLRRVFDQVKLSPQGERAMLERLLREERTEQIVKKRRPLPKLAAVLVAAALLLTTGVFAAVMAGLDGRLLGYFGGTPETQELLSTAAMPVNFEKTSQGATMKISQVIADRYSAVFLVDFTAPDGTVLDGDYYEVKTTIRGKTSDGTDLFAWSAWATDWELLEDEDETDNHISLLFRVDFTDRDFSCMGADLTLEFDGLYSYGDDHQIDFLVVPGHWKCRVTLPETDPGRYVTPEIPIEAEGKKVTLTFLYLSPVSFACELGEGESGFSDREDWSEVISLTMTDGQSLSPRELIYTIWGAQRPGRNYFRLPEIIDPAEITAVQFFGQEFSLES